MPIWVLKNVKRHWRALCVTSLVPALSFLLLIYLDAMIAAMPPTEGLTDELAKQQRKDVLGYAIYAALFLLASLHGLIWSVSRLFLGVAGAKAADNVADADHDAGADNDDAQRFLYRGERFGFSIGWRPIRSLWLTMLWALFALFAYIATGMALGTLAFNDPGLLISSTGAQASALADGTRTAIERGQDVQSVTNDDFTHWVLLGAIGVASAFSIWILLKALIAVPQRVMGGQVTILTALDATAGLAGIRVTLWTMAGGAIIWLINDKLLAWLPLWVQVLCQSSLFVTAIWLLGGMLAWHAQKSAD